MILLALLSPWLLLALTAWHPRAARLALPLAPLPLLLTGVLAGFMPAASLSLPEFLIGGQFSLYENSQPLLILAGLGWSLAGLYAASQPETTPRFVLFWLLTLGGQSCALLAADIASFYLGYVVMTLSAWGLVVHKGSSEAWRAGRVYLVLAFIGEAMILAGLLGLAGRFGNTELGLLPDLLAGGSNTVGSWLLFAGFAVKLGIVPLHMWLPLAHPVAPVAASAVLSGVIVKAGLLGWLQFLPPEAFGSAVPATLLLLLGLATALYGALVGLGQRQLKTVLAYSTVSQMGLLLMAFAAVLAGGASASALLGLLVLHHGLNKIALFLAAGGAVGMSRWRAVLFALPALALAGAPLSSGAALKTAMKAALTEAGLAGWALPLTLTSVTTLLLMLHAFRLARQERQSTPGVHPAWWLAVASGMLVPLLWLGQTGGAPSIAPPALWDASWPLLTGALLWSVWRYLPGVLKRGRWQLPAGDIVVGLERLLAALQRTLRRAEPWLPAITARSPKLARPASGLRRSEALFAAVPLAGICLLLVMFTLWLLTIAAS